MEGKERTTLLSGLVRACLREPFHAPSNKQHSAALQRYTGLVCPTPPRIRLETRARCSDDPQKPNGMNALLFERGSGSLGPNAFARLQTTALLTSFSAAPRFRFDGGERAAEDGPGQRRSSSTSSAGQETGAPKTALWAHQAGVGALALERFDGRMYVTVSRPVNRKLLCC